MLDVLRVLLYVVFGFSSLVLIVVILMQEGKGGGLASAFGGMGGDTFGVGAGGINRFTAILAVVFIGSAIILAAIQPDTVVAGSEKPAEEAPEEAGESAPEEGDADTPAEESDE